MYYVGECLRLAIHFGTILAHSDQPTTPTSEVDVLELIGKFEEFFVKQGTDFDLKTYSFGPLAVNAVMSCFRDFVSGKVGETEQVKSNSSYITEGPTTKVPKSDTSKYSGFWKNRGDKSGSPGRSPFGHVSDLQQNKKKKASLSTALYSDEFLESSFDELNTTSSSVQSLKGGSSPTRYESLSIQTGLGSQISTQTVRKQLKANLKLSDSAANRLIDMQQPFLKKKAGGRDLKIPPPVHRVTDVMTGKVDETIFQDVTEDISYITLLHSVNQHISQEHDITHDALCANQHNLDMELSLKYVYSAKERANKC